MFPVLKSTIHCLPQSTVSRRSDSSPNSTLVDVTNQAKDQGGLICYLVRGK